MSITTTRTYRSRAGFAAIGASFALALAGCGSDEKADTTVASTTPDTAAVTTPVDTTPEVTTADTMAGGDDAVCALAEEIFALDESQGLPTPEMLESYQAIAPDEIAADVELAASSIIGAGDDFVALFNVLGDDDVEAAIDSINAWEEEHCGIPHSESSAVPPGAVRDIEEGAARVDVVATDFAFDVSPVAAGRTSFVLTNDGTEAHFLLLVKLAEGVTLDQFMSSEEEGLAEGVWDTNIAAAGDEEAVTFDVEPGNYALVCFVPTTDGTPHAMLGMQYEFTVT